MARITPEEIDRIAALAHVRLDDDTRQSLAADLEHILDYVDRLGDVPTDGVPLTSHIVEGGADLRADQPRGSLSLQDTLANAPDADARTGLFRVPRVIGA